MSNSDDDAAGIAVSPVTGLTTTEAGGTASFTVVLTSQPSADVTVGISSTESAEGVVSPEVLTFTPATWNVARTVTVAGVDDLVDAPTVAGRRVRHNHRNDPNQLNQSNFVHR